MPYGNSCPSTVHPSPIFEHIYILGLADVRELGISVSSSSHFAASTSVLRRARKHPIAARDAHAREKWPADLKKSHIILAAQKYDPNS
ncbi:uncharacterized protein RSE6_12606 [Rhynchosporium secalis]|uniref:Uncharacterized protein n=1 Tax=Rhynchosporium secalis TaxID=38038 RepID=A0A1E1MQW5_RHYSE|nr:uncharacterized protein RSE6_12606 [Rhynchosporium secalis]